MRHVYPGKQPHHCKAPRTPKGYSCRFRRVRQKDIYLTKGDLANYELIGEKSAEAIVPIGKRAASNNAEVSRDWEGLNVKFVPNSIRKLLGLSQFSLILNKDRKCFGEKSEMPILDEPPCSSAEASAARGIRDPYVQWCERLTPSVFTGGAVYSIRVR